MIDIDSLPVQVHGEQPGGAWNGYRRRVYHPIVAAAGETGDILDSKEDGEKPVRSTQPPFGSSLLNCFRNLRKFTSHVFRHLPDFHRDSGLLPHFPVKRGREREQVIG